MAQAEQVAISVEEVKLALKHDLRFFINFFMHEHLDVPIPDFHPELLHLMISTTDDQFAAAVPRAHAKTTLAKLCAVYFLLFEDFQYILYMSETLGHSIACINDIRDLLDCENFVNVFGKCIYETEQEGKGYFIVTLPWQKTCILKAFGADQQVRGTNVRNTRPQLLIVDDFESDKNIATPEMMEKLKKKFFGPIKKCVDPFKHKTIWIGNLIKHGQMLETFLKSDKWASVHYGCLLANGQPLWPDMWPIEKLMQDYEEYQENGMLDIWFAEMMNLPVNSANAIILADQIQYAPQLEARGNDELESPIIGFITIDLASSAESWGHETVVAVHIWDDENQRWQIAEYEQLHGADPVSLFPHVVILAQRWGVYMVGIEAVQYQATVKPVFEHFCIMEKIDNFEFVQIPARTQKAARIITWAGMIKSGDYVLTENDFAATNQLLHFDPKSKTNEDDVIDACAHGIWMISYKLNEIYTHQTEIQKRLSGEAPLGLQKQEKLRSYNLCSL